jgi:hypothetical protein
MKAIGLRNQVHLIPTLNTWILSKTSLLKLGVVLPSRRPHEPTNQRLQERRAPGLKFRTFEFHRASRVSQQGLCISIWNGNEAPYIYVYIGGTHIIITHALSVRACNYLPRRVAHVRRPSRAPRPTEFTGPSSRRGRRRGGSGRGASCPP